LVDAPSPDAPGTCNSVVQTASEVTQMRVAEIAPVGTGGTVPDGTYHLIQDTIYTGAGGATGPTGYASRFTTRCVASSCDLVIEDEMEATQSYRIVTSGTSVTFTITCPTPFTFSGTITTVTAGGSTTVSIFEASGSDTRERIYERQ
jgi:hypothetical protein